MEAESHQTVTKVSHINSRENISNMMEIKIGKRVFAEEEVSDI